MSDTQAFIDACKAANEEIASILQRGFETSFYEKHGTGAGGDVSAGIDLFAERIFMKRLGSFGRIESEEAGIVGEGDATIVIDPIDGSANALSQLPYFGTSVAYIGSDGVLKAAAVCNLANGDWFVKQAGAPAMEGKLFKTALSPLRVIYRPEIGLFEKAYANASLVSLLEQEGLKYRSPGAVALSLAYARRVSFVLYTGVVRIYDFAAGLALCEGLEVIVEQDYVIVSQSQEMALKLEALVRRAK